jgi:prophage regulatory protein
MQFITLREVVARTRISRTTIWRRVRAGSFPPPVQLANGSTRYVLEAVTAWMAAQVRSQALRRQAGMGEEGHERAW